MSEDIFQHLVRARTQGIPCALATVIRTRGSTPAKAGTRMLVFLDGTTLGSIGGGCVEADVIRSARDVIEAGRILHLDFRLAGAEAERTGIACGGTVEIMLESLEDPRVIIVGAGHVGQATAELAHRVGLRVTVVDDRPDFANKDRFPTTEDFVIADLDELGKKVKTGVRTPILIMTRGHAEDLSVLRWALTTGVPHIGVLGSRSKRKRFQDQLMAEGHPEDVMKRVHMPVGLDVAAESVPEIAVSIVAQLIEWRRRP